MNYNSSIFWILFAALMLPYWRLSHKHQNRLLLVTSYIFYGFWDYRFLFLVLVSTYIDFIGGLGIAGIRLPLAKVLGITGLVVLSSFLCCAGIDYGVLGQMFWTQDFQNVGKMIPTNPWELATPVATLLLAAAYIAIQSWLYRLPEVARRKTFLTISMVANLSILAYFKYCDFFVTSAVSLLNTLGMGTWSHTTLGILLPAGISFYTFQSMSYAIDIYRKEAEPTEDFLNFALFVCFFPHLVAGPIMRAHTLLPQVLEPRTVRRSDWEEGLFLVLAGMFKKIVIADNLAPIANATFHRFSTGETDGLNGADAWIGLYAFALQIYADFSGYSSVARGISKWLGFELVVNFRQPYLALSPSDFWQRWHISLSTWLRDYLYIPLGGNRGGAWLTYRNLMLTMLLGGLWHGASWTFVGWGLYHGAILCLFRAFRIRDPQWNGGVGNKVYYAFRLLVMFHLTCIGWLLFRAQDFGSVIAMLGPMLTDISYHSGLMTPIALIGLYCGPLLVLEWYLDGEERATMLTDNVWLWRGLVYSYALVMMLVCHAEVAAEFIYFQF